MIDSDFEAIFTPERADQIKVNHERFERARLCVAWCDHWGYSNETMRELIAAHGINVDNSKESL